MIVIMIVSACCENPEKDNNQDKNKQDYSTVYRTSQDNGAFSIQSVKKMPFMTYLNDTEFLDFKEGYHYIRNMGSIIYYSKKIYDALSLEWVNDSILLEIISNLECIPRISKVSPYRIMNVSSPFGDDCDIKFYTFTNTFNQAEIRVEIDNKKGTKYIFIFDVDSINENMTLSLKSTNYNNNCKSTMEKEQFDIAWKYFESLAFDNNPDAVLEEISNNNSYKKSNVYIFLQSVSETKNLSYGDMCFATLRKYYEYLGFSYDYGNLMMLYIFSFKFYTAPM